MAERPQMEEAPVTEGATQEASQPQEGGGADIQNLVKELESIGVTRPEEVRNMATSAREAGNLARMLGEIRSELRSKDSETRELRRLLESQGARTTGYEDQPPSQGIDLKKVIKEGIREFADEMGRAQREAQSRFVGEMNWVRSHHRYPLVKAEMESKLSDPVMQQAILEGQTTVRDLFHESVEEKLIGYVTKSAQTIKSLGKAPGEATPAHVESGQGHTVPRPTGSDAQKGAIDNLLKGWTGTTDDVEATLKVLLQG